MSSSAKAPSKTRKSARAPTTNVLSPRPSWRDPLSFGERHRLELLEMLEAVDLREPRWSMAAQGDSASAINLSIRVVLIGEHALAPFRDVILIALWRCAAEGDLTAGLVFDWLTARHRSDVKAWMN